MRNQRPLRSRERLWRCPWCPTRRRCWERALAGRPLRGRRKARSTQKLQRQDQAVTRAQPICEWSFSSLPGCCRGATPQSKSFLSAVFGDGCGEEPLFQHGGKLRAYLAEGHANAKVSLRVDNGSGRFKEFTLAVNLDLDLRVLREGIGHVQVAAVETELGHARSDAGLRRLVHHLSSGDKWITRRSATLISHATLPGRQLRGFYP